MRFSVGTVAHQGALYIFAALLGLATAVGAQERPLKESQVTEMGLIEALAPHADAADDASAAKTRGFKLAAAGAAPARKQSILMTFATDSSELSTGTRKMLDVLARALQSDKLAGVQVDIEGHADPRGEEAHNLSLSQARAESVITYLAEAHHIPRERLQAIGKGSSELLNKSNPSAPENRRVSIVARPV